MKEIKNIFEFIDTLTVGDYFFFIGTFLLIVLLIYIVYLIKLSELEKITDKKAESNDSVDLTKIIDKIEKEYKPETIKLTSYEKEQEDSAIISYEELLKNKDKYGINYDDEYNYDVKELNVKKINLTNGKTKIEEPKLDVKLMQYDKEESFLKALKDLQKNLNN